MKIAVFSLVVLCTLLIGSVSWTSKASNEPGKQTAVTKFDRAVVIYGVSLKAGKYLFVHDHAAMKRGEACTYVYDGVAPMADKLVVSFHCTPVQRSKVRSFVIRSLETSPGVTEVLEFQFAGDTESHAVPTHTETHVVSIAVP